MRRQFSSGLALVALVSAQTAQAQEVCVEPDDLTAAVAYSMPVAFDAAMRACAKKFAPDGFMRTGGAAFADRFRERQDDTWQGMLRFAENFSGNSRGLGALFSGLSEDDVRASFDEEIGSEIEKSITPDICPEIERGLELIEPLPVDNASGIVTFLIELAGVDNPPICSDAPKKTRQVK